MKRITALLLVIIYLLSACTKNDMPNQNEETTPSIQDTVQDMAYFTKTDVIFNENFHTNGSMIKQNSMVYIMGYNSDEDSMIGTMAKLDTTDMSITYETLPDEIWNSVVDFAVTDAGIYIVQSTFDMDTFTESYTLILVKDNAIISETPLDTYLNLSEIFGGDVNIIAVGDTICLTASNQLASIQDGTVAKLELPEEAVYLNALNSDTVCIVTNTSIYNYSIASGELTADVEKSNEVAVLNGDKYYLAEGYDLYYSNQNGLYGYNFGGTSEEIMNWVYNGLMYEQIGSVFITDPNHITLYGSSSRYGSRTLMAMDKYEGDLPEREIIKISYIEDGRGIIPYAVIQFNASQVEYQVICEEYFSAHSGQYDSVMNQLDKDILTGNLADILVLDSKESVDKYGKLGLLTDLYTVMADKNDLFGCIRQHSETDGKLYAIPPEFYVDTLVVKAENLPEYDTWNSKAFLEIASSLDENQHLFRGISRGNVQDWMLSTVIWEFIDVENGMCSFETEEFIDVIEYLASLPEEYSVVYEDNANHYITDEILFMSDERTSCIADYLRVKAQFGEDTPISYIGYPSVNGGVANISTQNIYYAINENSNNQKGSWMFIEYLLSGDIVVDEMRGMQRFPSSRKTLEAWKESEGKLYYYFPSQEPNSYMTDIKPFDENLGEGMYVQANEVLFDEVSQWLDGLQITQELPSDVSDIITEELSYFYSGTKSAKDTVHIIQSRVGIYLSERK